MIFNYSYTLKFNKKKKKSNFLRKYKVFSYETLKCALELQHLENFFKVFDYEEINIDKNFLVNVEFDIDFQSTFSSVKSKFSVLQLNLIFEQILFCFSELIDNNICLLQLSLKDIFINNKFNKFKINYSENFIYNQTKQLCSTVSCGIYNPPEFYTQEIYTFENKLAWIALLLAYEINGINIHKCILEIKNKSINVKNLNKFIKILQESRLPYIYKICKKY